MTTGFLQRVEQPKPEPRKIANPVAPNNAYAAAALQLEARNVEVAPEGVRNHTLNVAAFNMGGLINAGAIDKHTVEDTLTLAARNAGLDDHEIEATIRSGFAGADAKVGARMVPERAATPSPVSSIGGGPQRPVEGDSAPAIDVWGNFPPVDGAEWMFGADDRSVIVWGDGDDILWAEGEALMIAGGMGLGKTTLAGMLVRGQLGLDSTVLGLPIACSERPILYLAMDRPRQIRRSMRRQFDAEEMAGVTGRLLFRPGPPISDLAVDPSLLARMALEAGAGTVYVDSLKDAVVGLSEDATAAAYNRARQALLARGVQICELHHNRKANPQNGPVGINDVFGSTWLTSGAGSVIQLTGDPGDLVVRFHHVKQPANEVGPWHLHYFPEEGRMEVVKFDFTKAVNGAGPDGLTAKEAAKQLYDTPRPTDAQCKKAQRQLDKLVKRGVLTKVDGHRGGQGGSVPTAWFLAQISEPKINENLL
ncbi:hypothetical protein A5747_13590 [Mycobacterium sp. IS-836]|uniref:AAA family ATPase n=1 Tax=Mycobacterium sp. IS-836 TaxID=1834160 RepID=UPI00096E9D27|nr:AAA family ATPase [Mycobacterium sp. IS-836]OMC55418.1 hypothetical protein A5747_13590 [Mycobacterium sp. IS-836]